MRLAKLNRTMSHRNAMFRNLVSALIEHEQIKTTFPKAKAMSRLAERVITWSKYGADNLLYRRKAESYLMNSVRVRNHLFENLAKRYENRVGGYTRIHRLGHRTNDHAPLAVIELVDNPRDLKRDKVIRTISKELAEIELAQKIKHTSIDDNNQSRLIVPTQVWRSVPCKSEQEAKRTIDEIKLVLPELTKKNLKKVLSEHYINAYKYCQPVRIPTREEALKEAARTKKIRREISKKASDSSTSHPPVTPSTSTPQASNQTSLSTLITSSKPKVGNLMNVKGIYRPLGAYTDFLYNLRLHFHRQLITLDSTKLANKIGQEKYKTSLKKISSDSNRLNDILSFEEEQDKIPNHIL